MIGLREDVAEMFAALEGCWDPGETSLSFFDGPELRDRGMYVRRPPTAEQAANIADDRRERHRSTYVASPRKVRTVTCHPDRPHLAGGLCSSCYKRTRYLASKGRAA